MDDLIVPPGGFKVIAADPPWQFRDRCNAGNRGAAHKYSVMGWRDIARLPVPDIAAPDCLLAMWWVAAMPDETLHIARFWGFELKTMTGFTWAKISSIGGVQFGMGHWTRANAENCLFATRGRPKRADAGVSQLIIYPRGKHSEKPVEALIRLEQLMGEVPRVELFTRSRRDGWAAWGDELEPEAETATE